MQVELADFDLEILGFSSISQFESETGLKIDGEWGRDNDEKYNDIISDGRRSEWASLMAEMTDVHERLATLAGAIDSGVVNVKAALSHWDGRQRKSPKVARTAASDIVRRIDLALAYLSQHDWIIGYAAWIEPWANWAEELRAVLLSDEWLANTESADA